mgnify:CR=1 FL=1
MRTSKSEKSEYSAYSVEEDDERGGVGNTVAPKRIPAKSVTTSRVRNAPTHKKPQRGGGQGTKKEEVGKIAQFIDINSIPDELASSPTRHGKANYAAPAPQMYASGPQAQSTLASQGHMARMAPPANVSPLKKMQPMRMSPPGQETQARMVPPLPVMRPMQLSRGDVEYGGMDDAGRGRGGDGSARVSARSSGRRSADTSAYGGGGRYSDDRKENVYDEGENDFDDDYDDDGYGGADNEETYYGDLELDGGASYVRDEGPRSSRSNRGGNRGSEPDFSSARVSPKAQQRPKGREQPPKGFNDGKRRGGGGGGQRSQSYQDDDDFWDNDDDYDFRNDYRDYDSPPDSDRSHSDSSRRGYRGGERGRAQVTKKKIPSRAPLKDKKPVQETANRSSRPERKPQARKRSPVARRTEGGTYAPPPLPQESKVASPDRGPKEVPEKDMLYYSRAPREVSYKPCSLTEYKMNHKPGRYVEIEKLRPDLNSDELKAKRANAERVKQFSKNLKNYNSQAIRQQKKLPSGEEMQQMTKAKSQMQSKRERMKEFSKNIPKPQVKQERKQGGFDHAYMTAKDEFGMSHEEAIRMQELEAKHAASQMQLDSIKKSLGMR